MRKDISPKPIKISRKLKELPRKPIIKHMNNKTMRDLNVSQSAFALGSPSIAFCVRYSFEKAEIF